MTKEELEEAKNCWEALMLIISKDGSEELAEQFENAVKLFGLDIVMPIIEENDLYKNAPDEMKLVMIKGLQYIDYISKVN